MWLMTKHGFYSVVAHRNKPETLLVRARDRQHLENLAHSTPFANFRIEETPEADYPYRAEVRRTQWGSILTWLNAEIDYGNFKDAVYHQPTDTGRYGGFLTRVWEIGRWLTPERTGGRSDDY